jgi:hypothetical protein
MKHTAYLVQLIFYGICALVVLLPGASAGSSFADSGPYIGGILFCGFMGILSLFKLGRDAIASWASGDEEKEEILEGLNVPDSILFGVFQVATLAFLGLFGVWAVHADATSTWFWVACLLVDLFLTVINAAIWRGVVKHNARMRVRQTRPSAVK